jgi:hypothetical protein
MASDEKPHWKNHGLRIFRAGGFSPVTDPDTSAGQAGEW